MCDICHSLECVFLPSKSDERNSSDQGAHIVLRPNSNLFVAGVAIEVPSRGAAGFMDFLGFGGLVW